MFHIILFEPEIPPNTGNIIRLCANAGASLHLIHPLGFEMSEKSLRRAGLDYKALTNVTEHQNLDDCLKKINPNRVFALTTKTDVIYSDIQFQPNDALLFGPETRGLPEIIRTQHTPLTIPMQANNRSLNLSNSVAIVLYEALRQNEFTFNQK